MINNQYKVIGIMSGTSLDGVDLAYITLRKKENWSFDLHHGTTVPYSKVWVEKLKNLTQIDNNSLEILNQEYTDLLVDIILDFIEKNEIEDLDFISSHGHTALHRPDKGITLQIGNLPSLAHSLNKTVICDFRIRDVELGGQGAPLAPIGDHLLFSDYDYCINLGGFANISTVIKNERIAYDLCPVNIVLNHYVRSLGFEFDDAGKIASTGAVNYPMLQELNNLDYYKAKFPKSLGLEWVQDSIFSIINSYQLKTKDILRTFVEHCSIQIAGSIENDTERSVFITGGGAYNSFLIDRIKNHTNAQLIIPNKGIIEYKEALIFALLGVLKFREETNVFKSVTGASRDHSSGKIYRP